MAIDGAQGVGEVGGVLNDDGKQQHCIAFHMVGIELSTKLITEIATKCAHVRGEMTIAAQIQFNLDSNAIQ